MTELENIDLFNEDYDLGYSTDHELDLQEVEVTSPEDYRDLYDRKKNTLCRIGQNRTLRLLTKKQKEGDEIAGLYRALLKTESCYAYYCMYLGNRRYSERCESRYFSSLEELVKLCMQYNQQHPATPVSIKYKPWASVGGERLFFFDLPDMRPVSFYAYQELVDDENQILYEKE